MEVLYYLPNSLDINKIGPILEHIELNRKKNNITLLTCNQITKTCSINIIANKALCYVCKRNFIKIVKTYNLNRDIRIEYLDKYLIHSKKKYYFEYSNLSYIKNLSWDNNFLDVGWAIVSTFVSKKRDPTSHISELDKEILLNFYNDTILLYESFQNFILEKKFDKVVIFNGRMHDTRPILRVCQKKNISCSVLEICGLNLKNWIEFENTHPLDIDQYTDKINSFWSKNMNDVEILSKGSQFFEMRANGIFTNDRIYVKYQKKNLLPSNFDDKKINIAIFNSSDDEVFSIGPEWKRYYESQDTGVKYICDLLNKNKKFHIYLRIHPNLKGVKAEYLKNIYKLEKEFNNLTIIKPYSKISSYCLLKRSDKIITFGSTIGAEATFWEKPSLNLGNSLYLNLDVTYNIAGSNDPLISNFIHCNLPPKPKLNAIKFGFHEIYAGNPFILWDKKKFDNKLIPIPNILQKILHNFYNLLIAQFYRNQINF